jgi:two-component system, sensor histidine kinase and response regulator
MKAFMQRSAESRRRALVVEERAVDRDAGVAALTRLDYQVEAAASAGEAVDRLARERFALVLLSGTLPDLAGAALSELRRLAGPVALPIVLVHAADQAPDPGHAGLAAVGHLSRPVSSAALERVLEPARAAAAAEPVVDMDHLLSFTDGDLELESELAVLFLSSAEAYYDKMSRSLQAGAPWTSSAHALKGASANLGARRLAALARAAEQQPPATADLEVIRGAIDEVGAFFDCRRRTHARRPQR